MAMGTVTFRPVLVLFHLLATTVPPVVTALPVVKVVGTVVSIISALFAPNEFVAPGDGRVNAAAFPDASVMVPPFRVKAFVLE